MSTTLFLIAILCSCMASNAFLWSLVCRKNDLARRIVDLLKLIDPQVRDLGPYRTASTTTRPVENVLSPTSAVPAEVEKTIISLMNAGMISTDATKTAFALYGVEDR